MDSQCQERKPYTVPELVARLNSDRHILEDLLRRGSLKGKKISGRWIVDAESAEQLLSNARYVPPVASRLLRNPIGYNLGAVTAYLVNLAETADGYQGEEPVVGNLRELLGLSGEEARFLIQKGRALRVQVRRTLSRIDRSCRNEPAAKKSEGELRNKQSTYNK